MKAKKYLVTGGTGFLGSSLVKSLVKAGHAVRSLDSNIRGRSDRLKEVKKDIELIEADIRDLDAVLKASKGVDSILHLAYINGTEFFYSNPELVLDIAIRGMMNVIDACRANHIGDLVLASSSEVYQTPPVTPTDEKVPLTIPDITNARYSYGGGKILCELVAMNYGRKNFDRVAIFRPHNVYGPDMGWEHVLPQFILRGLNQIALHPKGKVPFSIQGDGSQTRAFINIEDFTAGLMKVVENGKHLEIYHIGNPEEITIRNVAEQVIRYLGREIELLFGEEPKGATAKRCPDITKLKSLGFKPLISFNEGLPLMIEWYKNNKHLNPNLKL